MATLTKADLAKHLDEEIGLTNREAKEIVEFFFEHISDALIHGQQVKISGFGNFTLHDKKERPGRNPRTGEEVPVTARRVVTFHCGQKLKARVRSSVTDLTPIQRQIFDQTTLKFAKFEDVLRQSRLIFYCDDRFQPFVLDVTPDESLV